MIDASWALLSPEMLELGVKLAPNAILAPVGLTVKVGALLIVIDPPVKLNE
jgi:hypothetical protein